MRFIYSVLIALVIIILLSWIIFDEEPTDSIPIRLALNWVVLPLDYLINKKIRNVKHGSLFVGKTESLYGIYINKGLLELNNVISMIDNHNSNLTHDLTISNKKLENYSNSIKRLANCAIRMHELFDVQIMDIKAPLLYANIFNYFSHIELKQGYPFNMGSPKSVLDISMNTIKYIVSVRLHAKLEIRNFYDTMISMENEKK
jgi:hypothetical protein